MKRSCLLFALLLSWIYATTAQTTDNLLNIAGLEPDLSGQTTYYLKNVGTGLYMSYGGEHGTHCIETRQAHPIIVEQKGDYVAIASLGGYLESNTLWMDWAKETSNWKLVPVEGYTNQYYLVGDGNRVLTSVGNNAGLLSLKELSGKAMQRWIFTTGDDIRNNKMPNATPECPFDATVALRGGAFDLVDVWVPAPNTPKIMESYMPYGKNWENLLTSENTSDGAGYAADRYGTGIGHGEWNASDYNYFALIWGENGLVEREVTYTITLPAGTYSYSFEGFYITQKHVKIQPQRYRNNQWQDNGTSTETLTYDGDMDVTVSIKGNGLNGIEKSLPRYDNESTSDEARAEMWNNGVAAAEEFRDDDAYEQVGTFYLSKQTEVSFVIKKGTIANGESTSSTGNNRRNLTTTTRPNTQIFIDDFTLIYYGPNNNLNNVDENANYISYLEANIEEYMSTLNAEGQAAFEATFYDEVDINEIACRADYYYALEALEKAHSAGITAHRKVAGGDLTALIVNNSFERGDLYGWSIPWESNDTGVRTYATAGTDGNYLFNTWWQGVHITQRIEGLNNGIYKLSVLIASGDPDNDATVYLTANDQKLGVNPPSNGDTFGDYSLKFIVTDGTATIGVVGGNDDDSPENPIGSYNPDGHWWYKCDKFRLEYITEDYLELSESATSIEQHNEIWGKVTVNRTIKPNTWSTFVVPFDIPADYLTEWEVKELSGSSYDNENDHISLTFADATDGIEAGVPYMVRNTTMAENLTALSMENVVVNTQLKNAETDHIKFIGTYTNGYVPTGAFFISNNTFYQAADETNTMKAFRAYLQPKVTNARSLTYRTDGDTAIDNSQLTNDNVVTVVAIYNLQGVRLDDMQEGVNILQMSNGSVVKVIIK